MRILGTCPKEKEKEERPNELPAYSSLATLADTLESLSGLCPSCSRFICQCEAA